MADKIKITSNDFTEFDLGGETYWKLVDCTNEKKQQIISDNEKSQKYDDLMNANHEQIKENISLTEIYQENKKLKEKLKDFRLGYPLTAYDVDVLEKERNNLKEKLDGIQVYCLCKQDGDPENENPKDILDSIEKILGNEYYGEKNNYPIKN